LLLSSAVKKKFLTGEKTTAKINATRIAARYGLKIKNKSTTPPATSKKKKIVVNKFLFIICIIHYSELQN